MWCRPPSPRAGDHWKKGSGTCPLHFAQINQRDGFFLAGREPDPAFQWKKLEGRTLLADHGGQPLTMLKYAAHCQGVDWRKIDVVDAGSVRGDRRGVSRRPRRLRAPAGSGAAAARESNVSDHVVAAVGDAMPEVAFSSLMASREFLQSQTAVAFTRAYRRAQIVGDGSAGGARLPRAKPYLFPAPASTLLRARSAATRSLAAGPGIFRSPASATNSR